MWVEGRAGEGARPGLVSLAPTPPQLFLEEGHVPHISKEFGAASGAPGRLGGSAGPLGDEAPGRKRGLDTTTFSARKWKGKISENVGPRARGDGFLRWLPRGGSKPVLQEARQTALALEGEASGREVRLLEVKEVCGSS